MKTIQEHLQETREEIDAYVPRHMGAQISINTIDAVIELLDKLPTTRDGVIVSVPQRVYYCHDDGNILWLDVEMISANKESEYKAWGFHGQNQYDERDWTLSDGAFSTHDAAVEIHR